MQPKQTQIAGGGCRASSCAGLAAHLLGDLLAAVIPCWPRVREQKALPALPVWSGAGLSLARKATGQGHVSTAGSANPPPRASVSQGKTLAPNHPQTSGQPSCCPIVSPWALEAAFFAQCFQTGVPSCLPLPECSSCSIVGLGLVPRSQQQPGCRFIYIQSSPSKGHNSQTRNRFKNPQWLLREPRSRRQTSPFYCAKHTDFHPKSKVRTRALPVSSPALTAPAGNTQNEHEFSGTEGLWSKSYFCSPRNIWTNTVFLISHTSSHRWGTGRAAPPLV